MFRRKLYDEYNDEEVELTKEETKLIRRLLKGKTPHAEIDPYAVCLCIFHYVLLLHSPLLNFTFLTII